MFLAYKCISCFKLKPHKCLFYYIHLFINLLNILAILAICDYMKCHHPSLFVRIICLFTKSFIHQKLLLLLHQHICIKHRDGAVQDIQFSLIFNGQNPHEVSFLMIQTSGETLVHLTFWTYIWVVCTTHLTQRSLH